MRLFLALIFPTAIIALSFVVALFDLESISLYWKLTLIGLAGLFSSISNYVAVYRPLRAKATDRQKVIIKIVLDEFVREYKTYTHNRDMVRMNVRLPFRSIRHPWVKQLRIWFELGEYSDDERAVVYSLGQGACGKAFADNTSYWYDRQMGHDQFLDNPPFADSVNTNVSSQLCVPIFSDDDRNKDHPIGVLSIDSPANVEHSKFDDENVRALTRLSASKIGIVLGS